MKKNKCKVCAVEFETKRRSANYCSSKCRSSNFRKNNPEKSSVYNKKYYEKLKEGKSDIVINCKYCGSLIDAKRKTRMFCNQNCRGKYNRSLKNKSCASEKCDQVLDNNRKTYCSKECKPKKIQKSYYKKREYILECKTCGKSMKTNRPDKKYCKSNCTPSKKAYKKAQKLKIKHVKLPNVSWVEIQKIYDNCPEGHHVDHIIPRNHDKVCGLHVPWNLQYLPAEENIEKSNTFILEQD